MSTQPVPSGQPGQQSGHADQQKQKPKAADLMVVRSAISTYIDDHRRYPQNLTKPQSAEREVLMQYLAELDTTIAETQKEEEAEKEKEEKQSEGTDPAAPHSQPPSSPATPPSSPSASPSAAPSSASHQPHHEPHHETPPAHEVGRRR